MKFASYKYETENIGDEVQSIANIQYLPRIDYLLNRDKLMLYKNYPNITLIANGYYTHNPGWSCPDNISPIFLSFHGDTNFPYKSRINYMKQFAPIGCRDKYTLQKFQAVGVEAYFSGCLTTTLQNTHFDEPRNENIYFVDAAIELMPERINQVALRLTHVKEGMSREHWGKMELATEYLDNYSKAKLVVTSRIHCGLPSLAFNTPAIFVNAKNTYYGSKGFSNAPR
jgi:hypothetical protein